VTGTPVSVAGTWSFSEDFATTDADGNAVAVCSDAGRFALSQSAFTFAGTSTRVPDCQQGSGQVTGGTVSGRVLTFQDAGCQYSVVLTPALDAMNGGGNCGNGLTVTIQAHRSGTPVSLAVQPAAVALLSGYGAQLTAALQDSAGNAVFGYSVNWSSGNVAVASVSLTGLVLGATGGMATITATSTGFTATAMVTVTALRFSAVSAGLNSTCGVTTASEVWCWGGIGATYTLLPVKVPGGLSFSTVSTGHLYACGLTQAGAAYCWGDNSSGQLGDGSTTSRTNPVPVSGGFSFISVTTSRLGYPHSCGLTAGGVAYCWGFNNEGELGNGSTVASSTPVAVAGGHIFTSLSAGGYHTCGRSGDGTAYCWGNNSSGELGNGSYSSSLVPAAVSGGLAFNSVTAGGNHTCGLTSGGAAYCWGNNTAAQLGIGVSSSQFSATPVAVAGGRTFSMITSGSTSTCGPNAFGSAYCWGSIYSSSQYTNNETDLVPTAVPGGFTFTALSTSGHSCGLASDGRVYCWGFNYEGELGHGNWWSTTVPTRVAGQP